MKKVDVFFSVCLLSISLHLHTTFKKKIFRIFCCCVPYTRRCVNQPELNDIAVEMLPPKPILAIDTASLSLPSPQNCALSPLAAKEEFIMVSPRHATQSPRVITRTPSYDSMLDALQTSGQFRTETGEVKHFIKRSSSEKVLDQWNDI
jgi:hypothetical protein